MKILLKSWQGKELPKGDWLLVTQEMINDFAKATQDFQWIHVDVEKAIQFSPFKKPVAHGFLSLSLLSKMLGDLIQVKSVKMGVNYGLNKVRFPSPVVVDSKVCLSWKHQRNRTLWRQRNKGHLELHCSH